MNWFAVDKKGLAQLIEARGKVPLVLELISNAWDADGVTAVEVNLRAVPNRALVEVEVIDNSPVGFLDLEHAWTLFAPSVKKTQPELRGRFNLGEKLVLALCDEASIETTTGGVRFDAAGRHRTLARRARGTRFYGLLRMKREELYQFSNELRLLNGPQGIETRVSIDTGGDRADTFLVTRRDPIESFSIVLPTPMADDAGVLRSREREAIVEVFTDLAVDPKRPGVLHELGVPVVEIGGHWHVNVRQKVPLNKDRDNVPPSYLRKLRTAVLDVMHRHLNAETVRDEWVTEALEGAAADTVSSVMDLRFGKKRVSYDPSDPEANSRATAEGYTVVPGGSLPGAVWSNVRAAGAIKPAGQVLPTQHPRFSLDGIDTEVPRSKWTEAQVSVCEALKVFGEGLLHERTGLSIRIVRDNSNRFAAWYGRGGFLTLNLQVLGHRWFEDGAEGLQTKHLDLLLHELGHEWCDNHLSEDYHGALTRLGAALAMHVADNPKLRKLLQRKAAV